MTGSDDTGREKGANGVIDEEAYRAGLLKREVADGRELALAVAASLEAVMPLLKTVQQFCPPDHHDEIIARAEHNLAVFRATFK